MEEEDRLHPMFEQRDIIKGSVLCSAVVVCLFSVLLAEAGFVTLILSFFTRYRYLAQAATAGRLEEVEMLERNLRDLEGEMLKMGLISPT